MALTFCGRFSQFRACVDTSEKGELENCKVLTNFRDEHEYGTFSYQDMLNYTVRIMPDENILQIVTDSSKRVTDSSFHVEDTLLFQRYNIGFLFQ